MIKLFQRKKKITQREITPQLTLFQRRQLEQPQVPPGPYPYTIYDQMQGDAMVQTCLSIKKLGILAADYDILPSDDQSESRKIAEFCVKVLNQMQGSVSSILHQAMDAFAKGWSVQELIWDVKDGKLILQEVKSKDPAHFGIEVDAFGKVGNLILQLPGESKQHLDRRKFVVYGNRAQYAQTKGRSDLDAAYPHWKQKQSLLNAWRAHLERFASPTVLGKFQRGLTNEEQSAILHALQNLNEHTAIVYPEEIDINTLGGSRESSSGFMEALEFHNREIARAILGQTLTTDEGRRVGSLALGKVHLQVLMLQLDSVRKDLADRVMTEQILRPLVEYNFPTGRMPIFKFKPMPLTAFQGGEI